MKPVLCFEGEAILFDYGISKYLACDTLNLCLSRIASDAVIERDLEVLSLAQVIDAAIDHFLQGAMNSFALRIEHGLLERDVNVGFHNGRIIIPTVQTPEVCSIGSSG